MSKRDQVPALVCELYQVVAKLQQLYPDRPFTPDGHLVGSIGEVLAAHDYGMELLSPSAETHDARTQDGRLFQIKTTQKRRVALSSFPDNLLVLKLNPDGSTTEIYNGPGEPAWNAAGKMQKNGQRPISLSKLRTIVMQD